VAAAVVFVFVVVAVVVVVVVVVVVAAAMSAMGTVRTLRNSQYSISFGAKNTSARPRWPARAVRPTR
jgi:hypothetical protein